jgi:hypothetical protein
MAGPYDGNIGPLLPGQIGWIVLGPGNIPNASPGGNATLARPAAGTPCAPVYATLGATPDALMTPTGAPLQTVLNPAI